jgi:hypothetical protein
VRHAPFFVPALLRFPASAARQDGWGRLIQITAGGAELSTAVHLEKGTDVELQFELGGERLSLSGRVLHAERDDDGHCLADLRWTDMLERRRLARVLIDVLARA